MTPSLKAPPCSTRPTLETSCATVITKWMTLRVVTPGSPCIFGKKTSLRPCPALHQGCARAAHHPAPLTPTFIAAMPCSTHAHTDHLNGLHDGWCKGRIVASTGDLTCTERLNMLSRVIRCNYLVAPRDDQSQSHLPFCAILVSPSLLSVADPLCEQIRRRCCCAGSRL